MINDGYQNVLEIFNLFSGPYNENFKIKKALNIFGINENLDMDTQKYLLNEISEYLFDTSVSQAKGGSGIRLFDYNLDFNYYYIDFKKYNVDLLEENISWYKFNLMLNEFMLFNGTRMNEVLSYRTYEKPPKYKTIEAAENAEHNQKMKLKNKYSLPTQTSENTENGFDKLWKFLEKKAGDKNE